MKTVIFFFLVLFYSNFGFAKDPEPKTFLVLFKSKELKEHKISLKQIESQFSSAFKTKSYDGNSELALMIEIPSCDFDECFLGEFLVDLQGNAKIQLQNIAFRLFDLTENQDQFAAFLNVYEENQVAKKKSAKSPRLPSSSLGGPGH